MKKRMKVDETLCLVLNFRFELQLFRGFIWIFAFKFIESSAVQSSNIMGECHDMHGQAIANNMHYVPGPDICKYVLISIASTKCSFFFKTKF